MRCNYPTYKEKQANPLSKKEYQVWYATFFISGEQPSLFELWHITH